MKRKAPDKQRPDSIKSFWGKKPEYNIVDDPEETIARYKEKL